MLPEWTQALGDHSRGSRPRCVALVDGPCDAVAQSLTELVDLQGVSIEATDFWMPKGKPVQGDDRPAREAWIDRDSGFISIRLQKLLREWWLAVQRGANTPNWDLASTCAIEGRRGLLLVEAKAHGNELSRRGKSLLGSDNSRKNHARIAAAIDEANAGLERASGGAWSLSRDDRYQLSNRFAWAWKVAELGVPVVLAYLGFLDAQDMAADGPLFLTHGDWDDAVRRHAAGAVDASVWNTRLDVGGVPFFALIRSRRQPLV